jgi:hypothetical protein
MQVLLNTAQAGNPQGYGGGYSVGTFVTVRRTAQGIAYIEILDLLKSEVVVISNKEN